MSKFLDKLFSWVPTPVADAMDAQERSINFDLEIWKHIINSRLTPYERAAKEQVVKQNRFTVIDGGKK